MHIFLVYPYYLHFYSSFQSFLLDCHSYQHSISLLLFSRILIYTDTDKSLETTLLGIIRSSDQPETG